MNLKFALALTVNPELVTALLGNAVNMADMSVGVVT